MDLELLLLIAFVGILMLIKTYAEMIHWFFSFKPFCFHNLVKDKVYSDKHGWQTGYYCKKCGRKKYN